MQRLALIVVTLAATAALSIPHALAQTPASKTFTPEQHQHAKMMHAKFAACRNKARATKVAPKEHRAYMTNCLRGN